MVIATCNQNTANKCTKKIVPEDKCMDDKDNIELAKGRIIQGRVHAEDIERMLLCFNCLFAKCGKAASWLETEEGPRRMIAHADVISRQLAEFPRQSIRVTPHATSHATIKPFTTN